MGKTSVYLTSDLDARWRNAGVPLAEVIRRGLDAIEGTPDLEATLRRVVREEVRAEVAALPAPEPCRAQSGYQSGGYESEPYLSEP